MTDQATIMGTLRASKQFDGLIETIERVSFDTELEERHGLTLFAPIDAAWMKLPNGTFNALLNEGQLLKDLLLNHLSKELVKPEELSSRSSVTSLQGSSLTIHKGQNAQELPKIRNARISWHKWASNGFVYAIDTVLLPVAPPVDDPGQRPQSEVWLPYTPGEALPIGDAELVPGEPIVRDGVKNLETLLQKFNVKLNTARAVRLEEYGETTYRVPCAPADNGDSGGKRVIGMIVIDVGSGSRTGQLIGPFLDVLRQIEKARALELLDGARNKQQVETYLNSTDEFWERVLIDPDGQERHWSVAQVITGQAPNLGIPTTGITYGTKMCTHVDEDGRTSCHQCSWWENLPFVPECK